MRILLFLLLLIRFSSAAAIDPVHSLKIGEADGMLQTIEKAVTNPKNLLNYQMLSEFQEQGIYVKKVANECIESNEHAINKSANDLELLGAQMVTEEKEVTEKRQSLNQSMLSNAQQLASCRLMLLRAHEVVDVVISKQQQVLASELFGKKSNLLQNIKNNLFNPFEIYQALLSFIEKDAGISTLVENLPEVSLLLLVAMGLILWIRRILNNRIRIDQQSQQTGYLSQFQLSLFSCAQRHMAALIITSCFSLYYSYQLISGSPLDFLALLIFGLFMYVLGNLFIRILLNPYPPAQPLTSLPQDISLLLASRLRLLSKLVFAGFLMYSSIQIHDFPDQITALIRNVYLFLLVLNLIWAAWLLRYYRGLSNIHLLRVLAILGLLICLGADWLGYVNLSNFILLGITGSFLLWGLTIFLIRIWSDFLDSLDEGRNEWQKAFRKRIGVKEKEFLPGSIWFRFTFSIIIWSAFAVAVLKIWGLSDTTLLELRDVITGGFKIGTVNLVPVKMVVALLSFAVMLSIIGWIKRRMDKSWLKRSRMDRGSKEAMISLTGYLGVAIAFLIALSIAGVELANLALIAGALSVGIGFGLQNIVNNFVSGVILLFERPIKTGDWIVVGSTEGYVKKISIRSTQIQTFDRSDVIVPNSELISGQVTNWMFRDSLGRIVLPVGVAYGTDTELVQSILLDIAYQHPSVLTKSPILSKPRVLFRNFGDSSLNFELRCFIREVDNRLTVMSDMNFAIERAFSEAGIEIPFPQRDVHLISSKEEKEITKED
jgi:potassium-dependent mechanosensitive channel